MSLTTKTMIVASTGLFAGASLWLWQAAGQEVFITRVLAMATTCL
ncbi:MAG: hypothetical protein AAGA53_00820 [Pseudomonadota bacterium]